MALRIAPGAQQQLLAHVLTELAAQKSIEEEGIERYQSDINDWAERHFYIPYTGKPVKLPLHQKAILRFFFSRRKNGHFPFQTMVYSTIKKSGKSTTAGIVSRWFAETQTRYGEILTIGNDMDQAKDRSFKEIIRSIELTPGFNHSRKTLSGRWETQKTSMRCYLTGSTIKAIAVDAAGEAGGQQALTVWTELWGAETQEAKRFWDEMVPIPTIPDSIRMVETYAGYSGESELLQGLYDTGMEGHQLTAGELAEVVCRPEVTGESFEDFVNCWHETKGNPEELIPVWINPVASFGMYWDSGLVARRMPWQHMFQEAEETSDICQDCFRERKEHDIGITADEYYASEEKNSRTPQAFARLHLNQWISAESSFVPMESWDACANVHPVPRLFDGERTMLVASADAAVTKDCFGIVVVQRCPQDNECVDIRALKKWDPKDSGGQINLDEPDKFIRQACKVNNILQLAFDPYQLASLTQGLTRDGVVWCEPFNQAGERAKADSLLYDMIVGRRLHFSHDSGCPGGNQCNCIIMPLRQHISNCNAKMQTNEDSRLRLVKKANGAKIDLAVALSMAVAKCLYLRMHG